jgi:hypothetical protein
VSRRLGVVTAAALLALGVTVALGALSRVPYRVDHSATSVLRLAWRARGVRVDECRQVTAEEQAALPTHMRRTEVCEGRLLPYQLQVDVAGLTVLDEEIRPSGAREDRPIYVFHDIALGPGQHDVAVRFSRDSLPGGEQEVVTPAELGFEGRLTLGPGEIVLITYNSDRGELVLGHGGR